MSRTNAQDKSLKKGGNQYVADPRQQLFLAYYKDPLSPTFSSARASAIKAGYTEEYADNIMHLMPQWLSDMLGVSPLLMQAEENLKEALYFPAMTQAVGMFGPIFEKIEKEVINKKGEAEMKMVDDLKKPVLAYNTRLLKLKLDASMFVAERTARAKWGAKDAERPSNVNVFIFGNEQLRRIAARTLGGGNDGSPASA